MKKSRTIKGLFTLSKRGSLVFCKNCQRIVGSINVKGYRYINLVIDCGCQSLGTLEIVTDKSTSNQYEPINRMPMSKNGVAVCKKCETPIFSVIEERVNNYSFYAECICGEKYDLKPTFPKRLGETLEKIKKSRK